ncbi:hypothetical protein [Nocardiopsis oceani]
MSTARHETRIDPANGVALLEDGLRRRWRPTTGRNPVVTALGWEDVTGAEFDHTGPGVFLTPRSILVGPVGGQDSSGPCTHCLAVRWQRLRPEGERAVIEAGGRFQGWSELPWITDFVVDTTHQILVAASAMGEGDVRPGTPSTAEVVELSLTTLALRVFPPAGGLRVPELFAPRARHG